jgi:hypothetical protein
MFLSWKDVRKNVKSGKQDQNAEAEELAADDESGEKQGKSKKMKVHFSWDIITSFSAILEVCTSLLTQSRPMMKTRTTKKTAKHTKIKSIVSESRTR